MGGDGSGRKPDVTNQILRNLREERSAILSQGEEGVFLPNFSGLKTGLRKTESAAYPIVLEQGYTTVSCTDTNEDILLDFTMPANTLLNNGESVMVEVWFGIAYAGVGYNATYRSYFNGVLKDAFAITAVNSGGSVKMYFILTRTSATSIRIVNGYEQGYPPTISQQNNFSVSEITGLDLINNSYLCRFTGQTNNGLYLPSRKLYKITWMPGSVNIK